ncbi:MAG: nucleotidyltransferase domain-containing protein [Candidatus Hydrogenedentota bacterium]
MAVAEIEAAVARKKPELQALGVESLELFGSAANGSESERSDLDFLVRFRGAATFDAYLNVKFLLEDLFDRPIDLVTVNALRPEFRERILREAIRVA